MVALISSNFFSTLIVEHVFKTLNKDYIIVLLGYFKRFIGISFGLYWFFLRLQKSESNQKKVSGACYFDSVFGGKGNEWIKLVLFFCIW